MRQAALLILLLAVPASRAEDPIPVLLVTGSHHHDWVNTTPVLVKLLEGTHRFKVTVTETPEKDLTAENLAKVRLVFLHYRENPKESEFPVLSEKGEKTAEIRKIPAHPNRWPEAAEKALLAAVDGGTGCVALHYGTSAFDQPPASWPEYETLIGGGWRVTKKAFGHSSKMFQFKVKVTRKDHPITKGFPDEFLHAKDELYHKSFMVEGNSVLCTAFDDPKLGDEKCTGMNEPMAWVRSSGKGRVFTTVLGHGPDQMRLSPGFQALLARGCEWAATGHVTLPLPDKLDAEVIK